MRDCIYIYIVWGNYQSYWYRKYFKRYYKYLIHIYFLDLSYRIYIKGVCEYMFIRQDSKLRTTEVDSD